MRALDIQKNRRAGANAHPRMESDCGSQIQIGSTPFHSSTIGRPASHEEICGRLWATSVHNMAGGP